MGRSNKIAFKKGYAKVALEIINHPKFSANDYRLAKVVIFVLRESLFSTKTLSALSNENGDISAIYKEIASKILQKSEFNFWKDAIKLALEEGDEEVALRLVEHCKFNAGEYWITDILMLALKKGYVQIALNIVNHSTFKADDFPMHKVLKLALKLAFSKGAACSQKGEIQEISEIKNKEKYEKIVFAIVNNEDFYNPQWWIEGVLKCAKDLLQEGPEHLQKLKKIIDLIESRKIKI